MSQEFADIQNKFEDKWQEKWKKNNLYEVDPNNDDNFFITVAYPYPSGGMHMGHVGTYTLPDVFARFKRMQGYNVLFPMAWHVTGTPIIGALDRLKEGEEEQWKVVTDTYNVDKSVAESWEEPMDFANHFIENSYKPNMKNLGFSVDWRREFTTNDDDYQKFIEWQYRKLKEKGLLEKGRHPTKYDIKSENPVTTHDLLEGEEAERQEYSLVKFSKDNLVFPCATLRPETVYGVTHLLIKPELSYVKAEVEDETWIISEEALEKLHHQDFDIEEVERVKGEDFIGEKVKNPVTGEKVPMLPAEFIDPDSGSGVVMSVPAHAPYDWISLEDVRDKLEEYDLDDIQPKTIIDVEGYGDVPAKEACENYSVGSQSEEEALEEATEEIYEKEFHTGVLNQKCGEFAGMKVSEAKEELKKKFVDEGLFSKMWDFSEEVVSRSGGKVIISLQDSWFLRYDDEEWRGEAEKLLDSMDIIPEEKREEYEDTIEWLEKWPAIRNYGLGTPMPFDEDFIIEPLSDSTIYMAFYTIKDIIEDVDSEKLRPEFFDYVFNEDGSAEEVSKSTGINQEVVKEARESFSYWYPMDWRTSAYPLIRNHLTFMIYHHTALFDEKNWPKGIATWGLGTLEGKKMSSSKGHVKLPDNAINEYGADTTRFFIFGSREPWQDFDWNEEDVTKYFNKVQKFYERTLELDGKGIEQDKNKLDRYTLSRLQKIIREATEGLEDFQTRKAGLSAFFELNSLTNKYQNRSDQMNTEVAHALISTQIRLMAPFTPHICEELWSKLGNNGFVAESEWPEVDEDLIDEEVEHEYQLFENTVEDIREIAEMVDDFNEIKIIVADEWKRELFRKMVKVIDERPEFGEAMGRLVSGRENHADQIKSYLQDYMDSPGELPENIYSDERELEVLRENSSYIQNEFGAEVSFELEKNSAEEKASRAEPGRPAIILE
jgi:leucyl-tRNA synthetase